MKLLNNVFTIAILTLIFPSCKKSFLIVEDNSIINSQTYIKDLNTMDQFLNGIYITLSRDLENGFSTPYPEIVADNIKPIPGSGAMELHYSWTQQAYDTPEEIVFFESLGMNGTWTMSYRIIRSCNYIIRNIEKYRNENAVRADNMKGQALAIRAWLHFELVNIFAQTYNFTVDASHPGVPYMTSPDVTAAISQRLTVAEVYEQIITDLKGSIELLSENFQDTRIMNRAAAKALLARTYLFKRDFNNAVSIGKEICNQFPLLTVDNGYPNDLFSLKLPTQTEILFQLTPQSKGYETYFMSVFFKLFTFYSASNDIVGILKEMPNDVRSAWVTDSIGIWMITKYPNGVAGMQQLPEADYYQPIFRSSEIFLTLAEAYAKINKEDSARILLDAIRQRADVTALNSTASGNSLLDSIYKERRKELAFEGLRMFDLQRWNLGVHRNDYPDPASKDLPYPSNKAIAPIPLIDVKVAGLSQNSGY